MLVTIDRFEGNFAIIEIEKGNFVNLPVELLPVGSKEGSKIRIELDEESEESDRQRIQNKMNNLFNK